MADVNGSFLGA